MVREVLLSMILVASAVAFVPAASGTSGTDVVVAVIDTGIDPDHPEFAPGQVAFWWDFTPEAGKSAAQTDYRLSDSPAYDTFAPPFDNNGHGTATASLVAGANTAAGVAACGKISHAPGAKLAIAKVGEGDGTISGSLSLAIQWAVDVADADVVSISIGSIVPIPGLLDDTDEAITWARSQGVLVSVSAGNGLGNLGLVPVPSWTGSSGFSRDALVVGGGSRTGASATSTTGDSDPEVVSWSDSVCAARANPGTGNPYRSIGGTSFSAPLVSGAAASVIAAARGAGQADDPATVEAVLKNAARDSVLPYTREGWGYVGTPEVDAARAAAAAGTLPAHPCVSGLPCTDPVYEAVVADQARFAFSEVLDTDFLPGDALGQTFVPADLTAPGTLATSTPHVGEAEVYTRTLAAGAQATVDATYLTAVVADPVVGAGEDFDLRVYVPGALDDGVLADEELVLLSGRAAGVPETATWTAGAAGDYLVVVYGWALVRPVDFAVEGAEFLTQGALVGDRSQVL